MRKTSLHCVVEREGEREKEMKQGWREERREGEEVGERKDKLSVLIIHKY